MGLMDEVLGALLIGQYINCFLYGLELVAIYLYFKHHSTDHIFLRIIVLFMFALDTANTILQGVTVYLMGVTHFNDPAYLAQGTVYFALQCALPSSTALICQLFLVWRFFKVSKSYIIAALLCLSPLGAWISAVYATVALVVYTSLQDRLRVVAIGTAWLTMEAMADITISGALIVLLSIYKRKTTFTDTQSLLHRLMLNAFQTGAITASLAIAMLIAFLASKTTNINTGFSYVLGRAYALTLLVNLLNRPGRSGGFLGTTHGSSGGSEDRTGRHGISATSWKAPRGKPAFGVMTAQPGLNDSGNGRADMAITFAPSGIAVSKETRTMVDEVYPAVHLNGHGHNNREGSIDEKDGQFRDGDSGMERYEMSDRSPPSSQADRKD